MSLPIVLIVAALGLVGALLVAAARRFRRIVAAAACRPRNTAGPEVFRA